MDVLPCFTIVRIKKRCSYFGEKAQIVSSPKKRNGKYEVQVISSTQTFNLARNDFLVLNEGEKKTF
jgi:hypothetical protein